MHAHRLAMPLTLISALMLSTAPAAWAEDYGVTSHIKDVTLYSSGASVHRVATKTLPKGLHTVTFTGIPGSAVKRLIAVKVDSDSLRIREQKIDLVYATSGSSVGYKILDAELKTLTSQRASLVDALAVVQFKLNFLQRLSDPNAENSSASSITEWQKSLDALGSNAETLLKEKRSLTGQKTTVTTEITRVLKEMKALSNTLDYSYTVTLQIEALTQVTADLDMQYIVEDAGWRAAYDANLNTTTSNTHLTQKAVLRQESGEDWTDVPITLSTESPDFKGTRIEAPTLYPRYIDFYEKNTLMRPRADMAAPPAAFQELTMSGSKRPNLVPENYFAATRIPLGDSMSVKSDGEDYVYQLGTWDHQIALKAVVVPRQSDKAFLYVDLNHTAATPLFGGTIQLFRDGMYVGENKFSPVLQNQNALIAFGLDPNITVEHHNMGDKKSEKGLFKKDTEQRYLSDFYIKNNHTVAVDFEVRDQLPVSKDESIKVTWLKGATQPTVHNWDDLPGVVAWNQSLAAGESWTIKHHYRVTYPKGTMVR